MNQANAQAACVVEVVQHLRAGGLEAMVLDLQRLLGPGLQVHIVSLEGSESAATQAWERLRGREAYLHYLDKRPGWRLETVLRLRRLLKRIDPVAVHSHHIGPLLYGGLAARLAGVPLVVHTEHDAWHLECKRRRTLQRLALAAVRPVLVADSSLVAARLSSLLPGCEPAIIRNGIDTSLYCPGDRLAARSRLGLPQQGQLIGCAARLHPVKNHAKLLQALALLPKQVQLALAGEGELESELKQQARQLGIAERVHFLGLVSDMPSFYQAIDLFCLPSHAEGMPLSPLEAQACQCPVVATDVGGTAETVCPATGVLVKPDDAVSLRAALARTLARSGAASPRDFVVRTASATEMVLQYRSLLTSEGC